MSDIGNMLLQELSAKRSRIALAKETYEKLTAEERWQFLGEILESLEIEGTRAKQELDTTKVPSAVHFARKVPGKRMWKIITVPVATPEPIPPKSTVLSNVDNVRWALKNASSPQTQLQIIAATGLTVKQVANVLTKMPAGIRRRGKSLPAVYELV